MRCSKCGADNREGRKFCAECGETFASKCPRCGATNAPGEKFCGECGTALGTSQSAAAGKSNEPQIRIAETSPPENLEGERKSVTALFADIKGSTEIEQDLDPEEARAIIDPALKIMIEAARRYDGYVQSVGDGIFALFGAPIAHEDHPQRAIHAGLRMQQEIRRYGDQLLQGGGVPIEIRVGVNTGEVVMRPLKTGDSHAEYAPIGHTTNLASRMQAAARSGSVVVSEATRKLVEGYFQLKSNGPTRVKGVTEPVQIYEVTGLGPLRTRLQRSAARGYTKFVGRHAEMEALKHAAERARTGRGQIVAAMADPGVGKSRLFHEFKATSQSGWMLLEAVSFSHDKASASMPVVDLLSRYFDIEAEDVGRKRREKVAGKIAILDRLLEDTLPYLYGLLGLIEGNDPLAGMDAPIRRQRTLEAVKRILLRESLNQPLMVIFEDLHWIDDETHSFLNLFADSIGTAKLLMLVNYRPEYSHQWNSKTYYTQLRLDPLGSESASEMFDALLGVSAQSTDDSLSALKRLIIEKSEGTPLFMEEIVQALFEEGALLRNGAVRLTRSVDTLKIPPTVQAILASRIDRLPTGEKELLQTLAVIGSEFPLEVVRKTVQLSSDQLDQSLSRLQAGEFIYEQPAMGDVEYRFKHALTRDEAYNSLLTDRRKLLHVRTARAIEASYHERLEDHYGDLARHYRLSDNPAKAIEYLRLAGEQATDRGAYAQALANVEPALKLLQGLPDDPTRLQAELRVRLLEGRIVIALYTHGGAASTGLLQIFERVCELSQRLGDTSALLRGLIGQAVVYGNRLEVVRSLEICRRCLELAERNQNRDMLPVVRYMLALGASNSGDLLLASSRLSDLMKPWGPVQLRAAAELVPANPWATAPGHLAIAQLLLGKPDQALRLGDEALRRARQLKHAYTLALVIEMAITVRSTRREPEAALELSEALIALAEEHGFQQRLLWARALRGWAMTELGQTEDGIAAVEAAAASSSPGSQSLLALVYARVGRADRVLAIVDEELARLERLGARNRVPGLYSLKGDAILISDSSATAEAEACFRNAIEIARAQSAKWRELTATTRLARLLRATGRRDEARAMLADIYSSFTEGFATADLKDAKALLEELSN
jgi:class 3 adenylate cyclase/tetratricopeptide (TPR) repeat protein